LLASIVIVLPFTGVCNAGTRISFSETKKSSSFADISSTDLTRDIIGPAALVTGIAAIVSNDWHNPLTSLHYRPLIAEIFGSYWRIADTLLGTLALLTLCIIYTGFKLSLLSVVSNDLFCASRLKFIINWEIWAWSIIPSGKSFDETGSSFVQPGQPGQLFDVL